VAASQGALASDNRSLSADAGAVDHYLVLPIRVAWAGRRPPMTLALAKPFRARRMRARCAARQAAPRRCA